MGLAIINWSCSKQNQFSVNAQTVRESATSNENEKSRSWRGCSGPMRVAASAESLFIDLAKFYQANSLGYWGNDINRPVVGRRSWWCEVHARRWAHQLARRPRGTLSPWQLSRAQRKIESGSARATETSSLCASAHTQRLTHNMYYCIKKDQPLRILYQIPVRIMYIKRSVSWLTGRSASAQCVWCWQEMQLGKLSMK